MNNINIIAAIIVISILILLSSHLFIHKTFHTEVTIPVQPEALWNALMDEAQYAKWNTVLVPIEGRIEEGKKLKYEMTDQNNKKKYYPHKSQTGIGKPRAKSGGRCSRHSYV